MEWTTRKILSNKTFQGLSLRDFFLMDGYKKTIEAQLGAIHQLGIATVPTHPVLLSSIESAKAHQKISLLV